MQRNDNDKKVNETTTLLDNEGTVVPIGDNFAKIKYEKGKWWICPSLDLKTKLAVLGIAVIPCVWIAFDTTTLPVAKLVLEDMFRRNATTIGKMFEGNGVWYDIPADALAVCFGIVSLLGILPFNLNGIENLRLRFSTLLKNFLDACRIHKDGEYKNFLKNNHDKITKLALHLSLIPFAGAPMGSLTTMMVKFLIGAECPKWLYEMSQVMGVLVVGPGIACPVAEIIYDTIVNVLKTPKNLYRYFYPSKDPKEQFANFCKVLATTMMLQTYGNDLNQAILSLLNAIGITGINIKNLKEKVREGYFSSKKFKEQFKENAIEVFKNTSKLKDFISGITPILERNYPYFQDFLPIRLVLRSLACGVTFYSAYCLETLTEKGYSDVVSQKVFGVGGWFAAATLWSSVIGDFAIDTTRIFCHPITNLQEAWGNLSVRNFIIKLVTTILAPGFGLAMAFVSLDSNKNSAPSLAWGLALLTFVINTLISVMGLEGLAKNYGLNTSIVRDVVHELFADLNNAFAEAFLPQIEETSQVVIEVSKTKDDKDELPEVIGDEKDVIRTMTTEIKQLHNGCFSTVGKILPFFGKPDDNKLGINNSDGYEQLGPKDEHRRGFCCVMM